jgi:hypothetical protein
MDSVLEVREEERMQSRIVLHRWKRNSHHATVIYVAEHYSAVNAIDGLQPLELALLSQTLRVARCK